MKYNYQVARIVLTLLQAIILIEARTQVNQSPPCVTHRGIAKSPLYVKVIIQGNYNMKDLPGAQVSGREYFLRSLNKLNNGKYKMADGQNADLTFTLTISEYMSYYGANVEMTPAELCKYDADRTFNTHIQEIPCSPFRKFDVNFATAENLFESIARVFDGFVRGGWCIDCPSPCNPY